MTLHARDSDSAYNNPQNLMHFFKIPVNANINISAVFRTSHPLRQTKSVEVFLMPLAVCLKFKGLIPGKDLSLKNLSPYKNLSSNGNLRLLSGSKMAEAYI
jgi:hypothetical protein